MPLYEYECGACGHRFEIIQKFSDSPLETCPKCGGPVRKLQAAPAFHLKGSGWYVTDYGKKDSGAKETATKDSSSTAAKTEKPETTAKADTPAEKKPDSKVNSEIKN